MSMGSLHNGDDSFVRALLFVSFVFHSLFRLRDLPRIRSDFECAAAFLKTWWPRPSNFVWVGRWSHCVVTSCGALVTGICLEQETAAPGKKAAACFDPFVLSRSSA